MTNLFLISLLLFSLSSCTFLSKNIESFVTEASEKNAAIVSTTKIKKNLFCYDSNKLQLLLEDDSTIKYYQTLIDPLFSSKTYNFIQKAAMLSLIEMVRRPDEASPSSRIQYYLRYNKQNYYFDFRPTDLEDDSKMPYLKGVENLLKSIDNSKSISQLADIIDHMLPQNVNVSPELEIFLQKNRSDLLKNEKFFETFFKGDEVLTKHESFKRISLKNLVATFYKDKNSIDAFYESSKNSLIKINTYHNSLDLKCNVDITKDYAFKEDLLFTEQKKSHYFALKEDNNFFIAVSSGRLIKPFKNYGNTYFFKSKTPHTPLPVCEFKNNLDDIILFSTAGRNPGQHLKHLLSYDVGQTDSYQSLGELLNFSRHLFLSDPDRILYESKRGRKSQLDFFLTMNFPIYHVETLGDIVGLAAFKSAKKEDLSLIVDDRSQARLWCGP